MTNTKAQNINSCAPPTTNISLINVLKLQCMLLPHNEKKHKTYKTTSYHFATTLLPARLSKRPASPGKSSGCFLKEKKSCEKGIPNHSFSIGLPMDLVCFACCTSVPCSRGASSPDLSVDAKKPPVHPTRQAPAATRAFAQKELRKNLTVDHLRIQVKRTDRQTKKNQQFNGWW